jgi:ABC-type anion transport system duplicated permease subunit
MQQTASRSSPSRLPGIAGIFREYDLFWVGSLLAGLPIAENTTGAEGLDTKLLRVINIASWIDRSHQFKAEQRKVNKEAMLNSFGSNFVRQKQRVTKLEANPAISLAALISSRSFPL